MRTTSNINFYCRQSKIDKKGYSPIEVSININGKRTFIHLPRKEKPSDFEKQIKKSSSDIFTYVTEIRHKINQIQTELIQSSIPITTENLKQYICSGGIRTYTVQDMFDDYFSILQLRLGRTLKECSYNKYNVVYKEFTDYFGKEREANSITHNDILKYKAFLDIKMKQSTVASKMVKVRSVFKSAFDNAKLRTYPFNGIIIHRGTPDIEYLTEEEMKSIINYNYPNERLERVADLFVFQACSGLSYIDMSNLSEDDIKSYKGLKYISKARKKTGVQFTAVIFPIGIEILRKYGYKLPVISNQRYNSYLKDIQSLCRITKNLHSHLARKTYSCMLLNNGISLTTVAKSLGHKTVNTSLKYYAKLFDNTVLDEIGSIMKNG